MSEGYSEPCQIYKVKLFVKKTLMTVVCGNNLSCTLKIWENQDKHTDKIKTCYLKIPGLLTEIVSR